MRPVCMVMWMAAVPIAAAAADQSFRPPQAWLPGGPTTAVWSGNYPRMLADVDADGRNDVVGFGSDGVWIARSTGTSFTSALALADFGTVSGWSTFQHVRLTGDLNGDRRADVVGFGNAGVFRALSTGSGLGPATFVLADFGYDQGWRNERHLRMLADVDGDHRDDVVAFGEQGVWTALATASGGFSAPAYVLAEFGFQQGWTPGEHVRTLADVDGDGRKDIVAFGYDGVWTALATGGGRFAPAQFVLADLGILSGWSLPQHPRMMADLDRDGRADIVGFGDQGVWVARSLGATFEAPRFVIADFGTDSGWSGVDHLRLVADLDGGGFPDVMGFGEDSVYRALGSAEGFGFVRGGFRAFVREQGFYSGLRLVGDVNGDGRADLVVPGSGITVALSTDEPPPPAPLAPSGGHIAATTTSSITFAWTDRSDDERSFVIRYRKKSGGPEKTAAAGADATSRVIASLESNTDYCFTVEAESLYGVSPHTSSVCGRTKVQPTPPPPPVHGISRIDVFNCDTDHREIHVWTFDSTQSKWEERGTVEPMYDSGGCPGTFLPFAVPLAAGHSFFFVAVDTGLVGCGVNDPRVSACQRSIFTQPFLGDAGGPAFRHVVN
jgi:VCBS repeat protein/fibronectin type III domain protein